MMPLQFAVLEGSAVSAAMVRKPATAAAAAPAAAVILTQAQGSAVWASPDDAVLWVAGCGLECCHCPQPVLHIILYIIRSDKPRDACGATSIGTRNICRQNAR